MRRYAQAIAKVPQAIFVSTGVPFSIDDITIVMVPFGYHKTIRSRSFGNRQRRVTLAMRILPVPEDMLNENVSIVAHELFHAGVALAGGMSTGFDNERAAVSAEKCVTLSVLGYATDTLPMGIGRGNVEDRELNVKGPIGASLSARYGSDEELLRLFGTEGTVREGSAMSSALLALCRRRARQLLDRT